MYRVKIGNTEIPNTLIIRGSYNASVNPRECEKYTDALGIDHIIPFAKTKATISFVLRGHKRTEHSLFASLVANRYNLSVKYWNDQIGAYSEGVFHMDKVQWNHHNIIGDVIEYDDTPITLEEY